MAYVGQHGPHKGIEVLLEALPRLLERYPDAWLVVGGAQTPHTLNLEQRLRELPEGARERCRLLSDLDSQDKADLLGDCDTFASPSGRKPSASRRSGRTLRKPVVVGDSPSQACVVGTESAA